MELNCNPANLMIGPDFGFFTIYVYQTDDHIMSEMLTHTYFSNVKARLRGDDWIYIRDASAKSCLMRVADVMPDGRVILNAVMKIEERTVPDADGYRIQNFGKRGGYFHIVDADEKSIKKDLKTRHLAEAELAIIKAKAEPKKVEAA